MILGREEWAASGRSPLTRNITAAEYMELLADRAEVYREAHDTPALPWIQPLLEWFIWPGDDDHVILPDRAKSSPKPKRPAPTLAELTDRRARLTERLTRLTAARDKARNWRRFGTDDLAAYGGIGIRQTPRQRAKSAASLDRSIRDDAKLTAQIEGIEWRISRLDARIAKAS